MRRLTVLAAFTLALTAAAGAQTPVKDQIALFEAAAKDGRAGVARKTKPVDARPAIVGEVVVTLIKGEGVETRSKPAEAGDWVVRNRCPETGNEEYLVKGPKFGPRYGEAQSAPDGQGFRMFRPKGGDMAFVTLRADEAPFTFKAPWGEDMIAKPGDALVQTPTDKADTYRVAGASFACTYEVTTPPAKP